MYKAWNLMELLVASQAWIVVVDTLFGFMVNYRFGFLLAPPPDVAFGWLYTIRDSDTHSNEAINQSNH
uniref:Putative secreted protein n=1 Tax=Anopheles darlingi TaxID=43151 RepID=A0A2M4DAW4_ANODA